MKRKLLQVVTTLLFSATAGVAFQGCGTADLNIEAPASVVSAMPAYQPRLSSITVPVSVSISAIEEKLNSEFAGVLYKDDKLDDDNVAVTVSKNGRMRIRADNEKIYLSLPVHVYAKGRLKWAPCKLCPSIDKTEATAFDLVINTESRFGITDDYRINTLTSSDFEWGSTKPTLQLGPLKIGLARFVEPSMREQMVLMGRRLDKELQNHLDMRKYVVNAWQQIQQPIKLDNGLDAWLSIVPQEVRMAPFRVQDGNLITRIGITSFITVSTDGKPQVLANKTLPKLVLDSRLTDAIQIGLTASIPYEHASKMLQQQVVGQTYTFDEGKSELTINNATISPGGQQLLIMLDVDGKKKAGLFSKKITGKIYLLGTPYYDTQSASIKVRDIDYELDTKDKLLSAANWLVKDKVKELVQAEVSFPVQAQLTEARRQLQATLDNSSQLQESVLLRGNIHNIVPENIYLTPTGIKALVTANGSIAASVYKL